MIKQYRKQFKTLLNHVGYFEKALTAVEHGRGGAAAVAAAAGPVVDDEEADDDDERHAQEDRAVVEILPEAELPHNLPFPKYSTSQ